MAEQKSILLVEDEPLIAMSEAMVLRREGYKVVLATSGEEAIATVESAPGQTSLILMDIDLGKGRMDGTQAAQEILQKHDIPVLFLSSHVEPDVVAKTEKITSYGYVVKGSSITVLAASIKMAFRLHAAHQALKQTNDILSHEITERKRIEDELRESQERLSAVVEGSQLGYWDWDIETGDVKRNVRWAEMLGYTLQEIEFSVKQWTDLHHPDDRAAALQSIQEHLEGRTPEHRLEYRMRTKDGGYKWILDQARIVKRDAQGKPLRMSGTHTDVTERKQADAELRKSKEQYQWLVENAPDMVYTFSTRRGGVYYSPRVEQVLGYSPEYLLEHPFHWNQSIHPDDQARISKIIHDFESGKPFEVEYRIRDIHGNWLWLSDRSVGRRVADDEILIEGLAADVTGRKQAEDALRQALADKEMLMRELQHRVKNSLNTVSSLLALEEENLPDERSRAVFASTRLRIGSIAAVYEQLYHTGSIDRIDLRQYIEHLCAGLSQSYLPASSPVSIETHLEEVQLDVKQALPLGIIVNELVINALKYAFPADRTMTGTIRITLAQAENRVGLAVIDNGIGIPAGRTLSAGIGLELVRMLTRQINGNFELEIENGCTARVDFKLEL